MIHGSPTRIGEGKSDKSVAANLFVCQKRNYVPKNCKTNAEFMARSVNQKVNTVKS